MVNPQAARMPEASPQQLGQRLPLPAHQLERAERRLRPVLAALIEPVRRGAHAHAGHQQVLAGPGIGTARMDPDGEIGDHPDRHACRQRRPLRVG